MNSISSTAYSSLTFVHKKISILQSYYLHKHYIYTKWAKKRTCLRVCNFATVSDLKASFVNSFTMLQKKAANLRSRVLKYFSPNLHKYSSLLKCSICMRYYVPEFTELKKNFCQRVRMLFCVLLDRCVSSADNSKTWYITHLSTSKRNQVINPPRMTSGRITYKLTWGEFFTPLLFVHIY